MAELSIEVRTANVEKALKEFAGQAKVAKALGALGRSLTTRIGLGFSRSMSPSGIPWRPLVLRAGQPLVDTGRLRRSITYKVDASAATVQVGTNVEYARVHQFGATIVPVNAKALRVPFKGSAAGEAPAGFVFLRKAVIPPRPFMPINAAGAIDLPATWARSALAAMEKALAAE